MDWWKWWWAYLVTTVRHPLIPSFWCWVKGSWKSCTGRGAPPAPRAQTPATRPGQIPISIRYPTKGCSSGARKRDVPLDMARLILCTFFRIVKIMLYSVISALVDINISEVSVWVSIIEMAKILARNHREEISSVRKMPGGKYYLHRVQNYRNITVCKFLDRCPVWQLLRFKFHPQPDLQKHRSVIQDRCDLVEILDDKFQLPKLLLNLQRNNRSRCNW